MPALSDENFSLFGELCRRTKNMVSITSSQLKLDTYKHCQINYRGQPELISIEVNIIVSLFSVLNIHTEFGLK